MIPTYGQAGVVARAIDSALLQDYEHLEVIVVDDASPDHTGDVVASRRDARLRYFRNASNLGRVANYRHCLYDLATGDWVVNLDGDDYYTDPQFVRAAMDLARIDDRIVIVSARQTTDLNGSLIESRLPAERLVEGKELLLRLPDPLYSFAHLATLYRRIPALAIDFYRANVLSADLESLMRLACEGCVAYLDRNVGVWVKHGGNASSSLDMERLSANLAIWHPVMEWAISRGMDKARGDAVLRRTLTHYAYGDLYNLARLAGVRSALEYARRIGAEHGRPVLAGALAEFVLKAPYRIGREALARWARARHFAPKAT